MTMTSISLLVLRASDPEATAAFYSALGFEFNVEQHANGPQHFACEEDGFVLEIYPLKANQHEVTDSVMIGLEVESLDQLSVAGEIITTEEGRVALIRDPDGRSVRLQGR